MPRVPASRDQIRTNPEQKLAVVATLEDVTTYCVEGDKVQMFQNDGAGVAILIHA